MSMGKQGYQQGLNLMHQNSNTSQGSGHGFQGTPRGYQQYQQFNQPMGMQGGQNGQMPMN